MAGAPCGLSGGRYVCHGDCRMGGELLQHDSPAGEAMNFQLLGVNHKTAPVEVRELLAIPERKLAGGSAESVTFPASAKA